MTNSSLATSDLRELADAELDDVNGGLDCLDCLLRRDRRLPRVASRL